MNFVLTGCIKVYDFEDISVEAAKQLDISVYDRTVSAIKECYDNGYEILDELQQTYGDALPAEIQANSGKYDEDIAEQFEDYLRDKIVSGDFTLTDNITYHPTDDFGKYKTGYADIYAESDIDILQEFGKFKDKQKEDMER